ncbi:hypothetical protein HY837_01935 [archaeon]|nr:hypothetical protein [archaeon]
MEQKKRSIKTIEKALIELKTNVIMMAASNSLIDSLVVFLIFFLCSLLMKIPYYYSFIPFILYLFIHSWYVFKEARYEYIEKRVPFLKEQLRTVADNLDRDDPVVQELNEDVLKKMGMINNAVFLKFGQITGRITLLVILSFLIIFIAAANISLFNVPDLLKDLKDKIDQLPEYNVQEQILYLNESEENKDLFGNKSIAELGYQELQITLSPTQTEIDINKIKDPEENTFESNYKPKEIKATSDVSYQENIPEDYHLIVKDYFNRISK